MQPGDLFADRYLVEDRLGSGGMGVVHAALDQRLGRRVALKLLRPDLGGDPGFRARFAREASTAAGFDHPNVVAVHDYAEHEGVLYLVMRLVAGHDLRTELAERGPLPLARTAALVGQVAAGLDAAHRQGHVHRDVKPANVLLGTDADGREHAWVTDFGLAQPQVSSDALTVSGTVVGTAAYLSPEQLRGERATVRSDVYALGCVAFECLSGRPPFRGATDAETAAMHLSQPPPALDALVPSVPPAVAAVVARAIAKDPDQRPASARALADELAAAAAAAPADGTGPLPPASPAPDSTRVLSAPPARVPGSRRGRLGLRGASAGVLLLAAGAAALLVLPLDPPADDAAHEALAARLPDDVYRDCEPRPDGEGPGAPTALTCAPAGDGADALLVTAFADAATMADDFRTRYGGLPDGKCGQYAGTPPSGLRSTWGDDAPLACYVDGQDDAVLLWQYPDAALQVAALRRDGDAAALFDWWTAAVRSPVG